MKVYKDASLGRYIRATVMVMLAVACAHSPSVHASPLNTNLLENPGFESDLTGWTTDHGAIRQSGPDPHGGTNYLMGAKDGAAVSYTYQTVDLIAAGFTSTELDSSSLAVHFGGYQAGWSTQTDSGKIEIIVNSETNELRRLDLGWFYSNYTWFLKEGTVNLPVGARSITFGFHAQRKAGNNNDGYLDDAFLELRDRNLPIPVAGTHYVDIGNTAPSAPYTNWVTAATNIQDAVDVAVPGETVLVSGGVYDSGTSIISTIPNRIVITNAITVKSVFGPDHTMIVGEGPVGPNAVRCVYMGNGAELIGFTITNGHTSLDLDEGYGGGIFCDYGNVAVSNCTLSGNKSRDGGGIENLGELTLSHCIFSNNAAVGNVGDYSGFGGGLENYWGTLIANDCIFIDNEAVSDGGGIENAGVLTLSNCTLNGNAAVGAGNDYTGYGGGIDHWEGTLIANNCILTDNEAGYHGGGIANWATNILNNCTLSGNAALHNGGGIYTWEATLTANNCTISSNTAQSGGGMSSDITTASVHNCIFWYNTATSSGNDLDGPIECTYSCSVDLTHGVDGNITNAPSFTGAGNYHLAPSSPCINAGSNGYVSVTTDLDGNPRITDGTVDMGAYESFFITNSYSSVSGFTLEWMSAPPGWISVVQYSTNMATMPFTDLSAPMPYPANSYTDLVFGAESECFYKVELQP